MIAPRAFLFFFSFCVLAVGPLATQTTGAAPRLRVDKARPAAGFFHLSWEWSTPGRPSSAVARPPVAFELVSARTASFARSTRLYYGGDRASSLSGYRNGEYYFRVRRAGRSGKDAGPWSNTVRVRVEHHQLGRALGFLMAGALVFLATLIIMRGGRRPA